MEINLNPLNISAEGFKISENLINFAKTHQPPYFDELLSQNTDISKESYIGRKEENKMEIAKLYYERKNNRIKKECEEIIDEIISKDKNVIILNNALNKIKDNLNKEENNIYFLNVNKKEIVTNETKNEIKETKEEFKNKSKELETEVDEVFALLKDAVTYEQKMKILFAYGIVDENGKLIR